MHSGTKESKVFSSPHTDDQEPYSASSQKELLIMSMKGHLKCNRMSTKNTQPHSACSELLSGGGGVRGLPGGS